VRRLDGGKNRSFAPCQCRCGNTAEVRFDALLAKNNPTRSCGCRRLDLLHAKTQKNAAETSWLEFERQYRNNAKTRNYHWGLTTEMFRHLASQDCFYCGLAPQPNACGKNTYLRTTTKQTSEHRDEVAEAKMLCTSGVDRVDNTLGYTPDNVVPCCKYCNRAKLDYSPQEWHAWLDRIATHRTRR
jgi:hypothetical protein